MVIVCTNLVGNDVPHTANDFFEEVKPKIGRDLSGLNIDEDVLKRAMKLLPCLNFLETSGYIVSKDFPCDKSGSVVKGEFKKGRQMVVLRKVEIDRHVLTIEHSKEVAKLKKTLLGICRTPDSQLLKKTPAKEALSTFASTSKSSKNTATPRNSSNRIRNLSSSSSQRLKKKPSCDFKSVEEDSDEDSSEINTNSQNFQKAFVMVSDVIRREMHKNIANRYKRLSSKSTEEDEWTDDEIDEDLTVYPLSKGWPMMQRLMFSVTSSKSFDRKTNEAQSNHARVKVNHTQAQKRLDEAVIEKQ